MGGAAAHAGGDGRGVSSPPKRGRGTQIVHGGRRPEWTAGLISPGVGRASTMVFPTLAALEKARPGNGLFYGRYGSPTQWALEEALTQLEPGAAGTWLYPSGVAAVGAALLSCVKAGDHVLMADTAYDPTRAQAATLLSPMGVETGFYDPMIGAGIAALIRPNTAAILIESPGSLTFEVQDVPAIVAAARAAGVLTILDNTWATPLRFRAIEKGVDLSVQALTKYVGGHSDLMAGAVTAGPRAWERLVTTSKALGQCLSPDDAFLAARGLRTLHVRLDAHEAGALAVAKWLAKQPAVAQVRHPALAGCPGHDVFKRDFSGATGLFAFTLKRPGKGRLAAMVDGFRLFAMGYSWGGFESLALPVNPKPLRTATKWETAGPTIRLSIGLEDPADLIADLEAGLARYEAALP